MTSIVQSSTATCLIVASFVGKGLVDDQRRARRDARRRRRHRADGGGVLVRPVVAVAAADLRRRGRLHHARRTAAPGRIGRVLIGLGLITLALQLIVAATRPLTESPAVRALLVALPERGAARHRRRRGADGAVVLQPGDRAADRHAGRSRASLPITVALGLVLGANLGSGLLAMLATAQRAAAGAPPAARQPALQAGRRADRDPAAAAGARAAAAAACRRAPAGGAVPPRLQRRAGAAVHRPHRRRRRGWSSALLPDAAARRRHERPRHLDPSALATPSLAISCAAREALHQADVVETMLRGILPVIRNNDLALAEQLRQHGRHGRRALLGDQVLPDADLARGAVRAREPALDRHRVVHHQHGADRRHHRARAAGHRGQEDPQEPQLLRRRHGRDRATCTSACWPTCAWR